MSQDAPKDFETDLGDLAQRHFADTQIGHHTPIWNALQAFKKDVVELHGRHGGRVAEKTGDKPLEPPKPVDRAPAATETK